VSSLNRPALHIFLYFYLIASLRPPFGFWVYQKVIHLPSVYASLFTRSVLLSSTSGTSGPDASPWPFLDKNLSSPMIFIFFGDFFVIYLQIYFRNFENNLG